MSSKVDSLLKKAAAFERLAVYGDRKTFLQALSQNLPRVVVPAPGGGGQWVDPNPAPPPPTPPAPPAGTLPRLVQPAPGGGGQWVDPNAVSDTAPPVDRDSPIMMQKLLNAPAVPEKQAPAKPVYAPDPSTVGLLQQFLNTAFDKEIIAGQLGPIGQDSKWGPETYGRLKMWAKKFQVPARSVQELIDIALGKK